MWVIGDILSTNTAKFYWFNISFSCFTALSIMSIVPLYNVFSNDFIIILA